VLHRRPPLLALGLVQGRHVDLPCAEKKERKRGKREEKRRKEKKRVPCRNEMVGNLRTEYATVR